jgi:hypothetical protein
MRLTVRSLEITEKPLVMTGKAGELDTIVHLAGERGERGVVNPRAPNVDPHAPLGSLPPNGDREPLSRRQIEDAVDEEEHRFSRMGTNALRRGREIGTGSLE